MENKKNKKEVYQKPLILIGTMENDCELLSDSSAGINNQYSDQPQQTKENTFGNDVSNEQGREHDKLWND
jgi:hypothetical protein